MNGWYRILQDDVDDVTLGLSVFEGLSHSGTAAPALTSDSPLPIAPVLAALQLKSYAQYIRGVRSVGISANGTLEITPKRNEGTRRGFTPIESAALTIHATEDGALGEAVRQALELAR